ncbi:hypothetical protein HYN46_17175 [Aquirhabdus parva]|uniref:Uncharacterized protein n=2 Tax=Aquirhabdus parva TaxID=2283318 RepID=A0A345PAV6_9GAMM|nr:hypothetical protein HYN46_17175 [Aquirhabdus parva]
MAAVTQSAPDGFRAKRKLAMDELSYTVASDEPTPETAAEAPETQATAQPGEPEAEVVELTGGRAGRSRKGKTNQS